MSWENKSDFEINKAVAEVVLMGLDFLLKPNKELIDDEVSVDILLKRSDGEYFRNSSVDYCNNPSDAWSLIVNNNIIIIPCMGSNKGVAEGYFEHENPISCEFDDNSKALRAAMIVLLKMKGVDCE